MVDLKTIRNQIENKVEALGFGIYNKVAKPDYIYAKNDEGAELEVCLYFTPPMTKEDYELNKNEDRRL